MGMTDSTHLCDLNQNDESKDVEKKFKFKFNNESLEDPLLNLGEIHKNAFRKIRLKFHNQLCCAFNTKNVYFQPPETLKIRYPAIIYSINNTSIKKADNRNYNYRIIFKVVLVSRDPESDMIDTMIDNFICNYESSYVADGLNHTVFIVIPN